jgi:hypothetical protein
MSYELPFRVVGSNGTDELLAQAATLKIARGAVRVAARPTVERTRRR